MSDRYCVFGNPIKHSKSPLIHGEFARQTQQPMTYTAELAPEDGFTDAWRAFVSGGGRGANVTVPFKGDAFALCDTLSYRAKRAQAVNTLIVGGNGRTYGDTTDGIGLVRDLAYHRVPLAGKRVLVLGAGGAVRGILEPLLAEKPSEVVVANRTVAKAEQLAEAFVDLGRIHGGGFASVEGPFDVVINGTSASLQGDLPPLSPKVIDEQTVVYDMMYSLQTTTFNQWALEQGAQIVHDGLGMLVEQAAESFRIWRGISPATRPVIEELRND